MKKLVSLLVCRAILYFFFSISYLIFSSGSLCASEMSEKLDNPFYLPQTNFYLAYTNYNAFLSTPTYSSMSSLDSGGPNTYGFDIEVNSLPFMNIGGYFRIETPKVNLSQDVNGQFAALLGGFARFFYIPPFFKTNSFIANLFLRFELGGGPIFLQGPSGLTAQTGIYGGMEAYFSKWIGLGLSYGYSFELGKETFYSNDAFASKFQGANFWLSGPVFALSLKTTFF